jgi:hypothetical protein
MQSLSKRHATRFTPEKARMLFKSGTGVTNGRAMQKARTEAGFSRNN